MARVSIILRYNEKLGYSDEEFNETLKSIIQQNYPDWEIVIADERGEGSSYPNIENHDNIVHVVGDFKNRAQALNAAITRASGKYILLVDNIGTRVSIRLSTLETFVMIAERHHDLGMLYSDYRLIDSEGNEKDIHLLSHHGGRVRDNQDYGVVRLYPKDVIDKVGGLDESFDAADLYDLRLSVSEKHRLVHINAAVNGYTYVVKAAAKAHNVFDYLMASKEVQLEMEKALTEHLKRIQAYMAPGQNYGRVSYSTEEQKKDKNCVASIVIPVFNREEFIGTAIESVQAQTVQNVEVIIVSNGGKDDPTIRGVKPYLQGGEKYDPKKPEVRIFIEDVNSIGFCLNKGLKEARGKYYIQLDSDDRLKPDAVEKIIEVFDSDDRIGMVIGSYEVWQKNDDTGEITRVNEIPVVTHDEWTEENGRNNLLRINGAGAPRAAHIKIIQKLGGFGMNDSPSCRNYGEDYDLVLRMSEKYRIGRVWDPVYDVIRHSGGTDHSIDQITIDRNDDAKDQMRKEAIERRKRLTSQTS